MSRDSHAIEELGLIVAVMLFMIHGKNLRVSGTISKVIVAWLPDGVK